MLDTITDTVSAFFSTLYGWFESCYEAVVGFLNDNDASPAAEGTEATMTQPIINADDTLHDADAAEIISLDTDEEETVPLERTEEVEVAKFIKAKANETDIKPAKQILEPPLVTHEPEQQFSEKAPAPTTHQDQDSEKKQEPAGQKIASTAILFHPNLAKQQLNARDPRLAIPKPPSSDPINIPAPSNTLEDLISQCTPDSQMPEEMEQAAEEASPTFSNFRFD